MTIISSNTTGNSPNDESAVMSYFLLRQLIGIIGILLPFILIGGASLLSNCNEFQPSISHYYYSIMHIVFVGLLCLMGGFLITYRGKINFENIISNIAGFCAICVAIFPTNFNGFRGVGGNNCQFICLTTANNDMVPAYIGKIHFGFAAVLFVCFVFFCMVIFQKPDSDTQIGIKKERRNITYKICGIIIIISILCMAGITLYNGKTHDIWPDYVRFFETTSLIPFGFSWLLKGSFNWPVSKYAIKRIAIQYFR
jgi:heme A synthase